MKLSSFAFIIFGALVVAADSPTENVLKLTSKTFDNAITENEHILVEFYAPWCAHCKALAPKYEEAATTLKEKNIKAKLAKVDCTLEKEVCEKHRVKGYPTLKYFTKGKPRDYDGGRSASDFVSYIKRFSGPVLTDVKTAEDVKEFTADNGVVVVAFLKSDANRATLEKIGEKLRSSTSFAVAPHSILSSVDPDTASARAPALLLYAPFNQKPILFKDEKLTEDAVKTFVNAESFPLIDEITPGNYKSYFDREIPIVWNFLEKSGREDHVATLKEAAAASKGKLSWVWLDAVDYARHAETMGLSDKWPGVIIDDQKNKKKWLYPSDSKFEASELSDWADKVLSGEIAPFVKSEEIPEKNDGPLIKVVGKNYKEIVLDETKDVMLEFFAPWCGHCQQLAPKYKALANVFRDDESVVVAHVDATLNDIPLDVKGFPTIFFFPGGQKSSPLVYGGERSLAALAKYIADKSTTLSEERKKAVAAMNDDSSAESEDGEEPEPEEGPSGEEEDEKEEL